MQEFFYKLFPFRSLWSIDSNSLTIWWVVVIILIFFGFFLTLLFKTRKLKRKLKQFSQKFSEEAIQKESILSPIWEDYKYTFLEYNGSKKTDELSYDYFNEHNLLSSGTNLPLINSIPSTLVGIGILGTFFGLTYGISDFNTENSQEIQESIKILLSGMGTAFVTSIYGMFFSLIFSIFERIQVNSLHGAIHSFTYNLDKLYKISKEDERSILLSNQKKTLTELFIFKDENQNAILPSNVLRDLYKEAEKQSVALQSFSTDLANIIEAGFERILNDPEEGVMFELQNLNNSIIELGSKLQDPASEMTQNVVKELENSMAEMINEFKESVSGSTKSELENLSSLLSQAGNSLNDFPNKLEIMTNKLSENFQGLQTQVTEISEQTLQQSQRSTESMRSQVEEMSEILKSKVGDLQVGQEVLLTAQTKNIEHTENLLVTFNSSISKLRELSDTVTDTLSSFEEVMADLGGTSENLKTISVHMIDSSESIKETQKTFSDQSTKFIENNSQTLEKLQTSLSIAEKLSSEYAQKFGIIESGLKEIFGKIENGLQQYRNTINQSLEDFLGQYTHALTNMASSLSGAASKQEDILEELTEQLDKLLNR